MIEVLCKQLPSSFCEIDELAAILLRFCQRGAAHLRAVYDRDDAVERMYEASDHIERWFREHLAEDWLDDEELGQVARLLREADLELSQLVDREQSAVAAARATAEALDRSHGRRFLGVFRGRGTIELRAGDPFPIVHPPLKALFGNRLGTNPARLGLGFGELTRLRLMPPLTRGHIVRMSFEHEHALADLSPDTRIGVAIPGDVAADLTFELADAPSPRFSRVRPREPQRQRDTVLALLDEAAARGVRVLVFPELTLDEDTLVAVRDWLSRSAYRVSLVVAGTAHAVRGKVVRNVCTTLLPGGRAIEHFKFNPFFLTVRNPNTGVSVNYREDIAITPSVITIHVCADWSFTTLVCKDFLEPEVDRILEETQVRMVLVPACTPKTDAFEGLSGWLTTRNQAVVVVGNLTDPAPHDPASVLLVRPTLLNQIHRVARSSYSPPYLHFFDLHDDSMLD